MNKKVILTILDGWGHREETEGNAVYHARTPNIDFLLEKYPNTLIRASGEFVGLPDGQMGNSEVGHLTLGAGRIVAQDFTRIDHSIKIGEFSKSETFVNLMENLPEHNALHIMGLASYGGIHSHLDHLKELLAMTRKYRKDKVFIHAFTDGRDSPPHSGIKYIRDIEKFISDEGVGKIASISGRYYAMDRDNRWDRVKKAYDAMVHGEGRYYDSAIECMQAQYQEGITDEFILPSIIKNADDVPGLLHKGDGAIFFNFRADRGRELTAALTLEEFDAFERDLPGIKMVTMTQYDESFKAEVAFPHLQLLNILGEVISRKFWKQLRIAETEKYPHVTYFFNGGEERAYPGVERVLIPSPKVPTYDMQPEMSAYSVTERCVGEMSDDKYRFIVLNFANCDMVGHTGNFDAAVKAVECVDECVGRIYQAAEKNGYTMLLTADHGNAEQMIADDGEPHTAHTTNPVKFIFIGDHLNPKLRNDGSLQNIAPTVLELLGLEKPVEMAESIVEKY